MRFRIEYLTADARLCGAFLTGEALSLEEAVKAARSRTPPQGAQGFRIYDSDAEGAALWGQSLAAHGA